MSLLTFRNPLSPEDRETFLGAIRQGLAIKNACKLIGRDHRTMYRMRNGEKRVGKLPDLEFAAAWDEAVVEGKAVRKDVLQDLVYQIAQYGENDRDRLKAAELELRRLAPEEYRDNVRLEHSGGLEVASPDVAAALDRFTTTLRQLGQSQLEPGGDLRLTAGSGAEIVARGSRG